MVPDIKQEVLGQVDGAWLSSSTKACQTDMNNKTVTTNSQMRLVQNDGGRVNKIGSAKDEGVNPRIRSKVGS